MKKEIAMLSTPKKVALITTVIAPYRIPVFNALAAHEEIDLMVYFMSETRVGRDWKVYQDEIQFPYCVLSNQTERSSYTLDISLAFRLLTDLRQENYDCVVWGGYNYLAVWLGVCWSRLSGFRSILWSESNYYDKVRRWAVELPKSGIVRAFDGYVAAGYSSRNYLSRLGVSPNEVYIAPDAVDVDFFHNNSLVFQKDALALKKRYGFPSRLVLYVGRLVSRKGLSTLLSAMGRLNAEDVGILVVGDGPKRRDYEDIAHREGVNQITFTGFQYREKLPFYYGISDVFVMPSFREPWGLVLNEAMSCRLPVIASKTAGATADLVVNGVNGFVLEPGNVDQLTSLLNRFLRDDDICKRMGRKSWEIIQFYTPERCALGLAEAILSKQNTMGNWSLLTHQERISILNEDQDFRDAISYLEC